jgi:polyphenol oxidase
MRDLKHELIRPDWAVTHAQAFATSAAFGDAVSDAGRAKLRSLVPAEPRWMHQVHGARVIDADATPTLVQADAAVARRAGTVCVVKIADCMPVLFAADGVIGAAHAGWRGLASGVLEATVDAMRAPPASISAWLGPAIGPRVYEVGDEVRAAFAGYEEAFQPTRKGHWLLDLYAVARRKLNAKGVQRIHGGGFCTYSEPERFFSYRRNKATERMAALVWLESPTP